MQIRSGAYRVSSEPRSIPVERDAGRNRAILSIEDSLARANKIFTAQPPLRSSPSYRERSISIGYLLSRRIFDASLDYAAHSRLIDAFDPVVARGRDYRVRDPCTSQRVSLLLFSLLPSFSERLFKFATRSRRFSPFPSRNYPPGECFVSKINALRDSNL